MTPIKDRVAALQQDLRASVHTQYVNPAELEYAEYRPKCDPYWTVRVAAVAVDIHGYASHTSEITATSPSLDGALEQVAPTMEALRDLNRERAALRTKGAA